MEESGEAEGRTKEEGRTGHHQKGRGDEGREGTQHVFMKCNKIQHYSNKFDCQNIQKKTCVSYYSRLLMALTQRIYRVIQSHVDQRPISYISLDGTPSKRSQFHASNVGFFLIFPGGRRPAHQLPRSQPGGGHRQGERVLEQEQRRARDSGADQERPRRGPFQSPLAPQPRALGLLGAAETNSAAPV